jgi:membrane protein
MNWLILLIGAQLAFYVQYPHCMRHGRDMLELGAADREQVGLSIMYLIGRDYAEGKSHWNAGRLAAEFDVPGIALSTVLGGLERAGLILATEQENFVPGKDPQGIMLSDILDAVRSREPGRGTIQVRPIANAAGMVRQLEDSIRRCLQGRSLSDWIAESRELESRELESGESESPKI